MADLNRPVAQAESSSIPAITEFTLYPDLAPELQIFIWKFALPTNSNLITMSVAPYRGKKWDRTKYSGVNKHRAQYTIPTMLHVNQQARDVALKTYIATFTPHLSGVLIYLDYSKDCIMFTNGDSFLSFMAACPKNDVTYEKIRFVIMEGGSQWELSAFKKYMHRFTGLNKLFIQEVSTSELLRDHLTLSPLEFRLAHDTRRYETRTYRHLQALCAEAKNTTLHSIKEESWGALIQKLKASGMMSVYRTKLIGLRMAKSISPDLTLHDKEPGEDLASKDSFLTFH